MEIGLRFTGLALNAVDAKGRVSLPAGFRAVVERRVERVVQRDGLSLPKSVWIGRHKRFPALQAFDVSYQETLHQRLEQRAAAAAAAGDEDLLAAFDDEQLDAFSAYEEVSFDPNGRMVLPAGLRRRAGLDDLAFFVAAGETFQIWNPDRFREHHGDKERAIERLDDALAERAAKARGADA